MVYKHGHFIHGIVYLTFVPEATMKFLAIFALLCAFVLMVAAFEEQKSDALAESSSDLAATDALIVSFGNEK